jgi:hypothetical protein
MATPIQCLEVKPAVDRRMREVLSPVDVLMVQNQRGWLFCNIIYFYVHIYYDLKYTIVNLYYPDLA